MPPQKTTKTPPPKHPVAKHSAARGTKATSAKTSKKPSARASKQTPAQPPPLLKRGGNLLGRVGTFFTILAQRTRSAIQRERKLTAPASKAPEKSKSPSAKPAAAQPTAGKPAAGKPAIEFPPAEPPSLDRRLDIVGVVLIFVGLPLMLVLASANHADSTLSLLNLLWQGLGWGVYLLPLAMIVVGGWLVLRNFERVPWPSPERIIGVLLLFFNLLVWFDFLFSRGGWVGLGIRSGLALALGAGGAGILLLAWLLIAIIFTLDKPVADLFAWLPPLILRLQDAWDDYRSRNGSGPTLPLGNLPDTVATPSGQAQPAVVAAPPGVPITTTSGPARIWQLPSVDEILEPGTDVAHDDEYDRQRAAVIEQTLASFSAPVNVVEINRGPAITQFGVEPDFVENRTGRTRVRVGKITSLADDLALALAAKTIRIQAPVPGKGYVGIEVPNEQIANVALRDVIESDAFGRLKSPLRFALGEDVAGNAVAAALDAMPHLLVAGATGSGKSVCVNALICCLLLHNTPDDVRMIMVDPKRVELTGYNGIPHLLAPVVVEMERVVGVLQWVLREMDSRYQKLAGAGARNIVEYNQKIASDPKVKRLPRLVVFIDELADLMMLAPEETERSLARLAQLARATGIHIVIATQRPSVDVVTGLIKANFPARVAFAVASGIDSRVILDQPGAERLLGRGDMLFQAPDSPAPLRIQGAWLSDTEIQRLVTFWRGQTGLVETTSPSATGVVDALPVGIPLKQMPLWDGMDEEQEGDPLYQEAVDIIRRQGRASITMLQRRLRIGYTRSARLIETLQEKKIIGTESTPQGFEVLDYGGAAPPVEE
jgi:S-DNA-T family DNA segregation ATPase FtsK/SpoIIIE